ncbi:MAG: formyltransferase family protein, partial [Bacillota bacterium]
MSGYSDAKARIAVLVSGGGTNLQALIDAQKSGVLKSGEIRLVISNRKDAYALERAEKA